MAGQTWNYQLPGAHNPTGYAAEDEKKKPPPPNQPPPIPTRPRTTAPITRPSAPSRGGGGGGGGGGSAQAAANARENELRRKAGQRMIDQAANLDPQIKALKRALDVEFKRGLDQNLADVGQLLEEQINILKGGASERSKEFLEAADNTGKATSRGREQGLSNLVQERAETLSSVLAQGAGSTDMLRAMVVSARNWETNAAEVNRAHFDTVQSINQSITDLNLDTQAALANSFTQAESERERLWQDYYNRRSQTFTELGNLYGRQADLYEEAEEMGVGSGGKSKKSVMEKAFMDSAKESGKSYKKQKLPDWIAKYEGTERVEATAANSQLAAAPVFEALGSYEGAGSRRRAA